MLYNQLGQPRPMVMTGFNQKTSTMKSNQSVTKSAYGSLYQRALNDKIKSSIIKSQYDQQPSRQMGKGGVNRHTPSSTSMQVSTLDLIEFVIGEYEQNNLATLKPPGLKDPYSIYEDLKIIYCLGCKEDQITNSQYLKLAEEGYVNRSQESIRSRYQDFLKYLTKDDYQNILSYVDTNGLKGYLIFEKDDKGARFLQRIQKQDPRHSASESNRGSKGGANNLQVGSSHNLSGSHTPVKSPRAGQFEDRPHSPNIFSFTPSKRTNINQQYQNQANNFMPYYMPGYSYPMFPQQQMGGDGRASPFKPPMFYDPQTQQPMMFPPYFMNPYMYGQMAYPPFMNQGGAQNQYQYNDEEGEDENESVQVEVRPSMKKSTIKQKESQMVDEEDMHETISKKKKGNNQQPENIVSQAISQNASKQNTKQEKKQQQKLVTIPEKPQIATIQKQQPPKIQTTLVLPKFSGIQINKQSYMIPQIPVLDQGQNKQMTREVYDMIGDDDKIPQDQFKSMMEYVAEQIKLPIEQVIDILESLSGSFKDFSVYLQTKQENMLWNSEEDTILSQIKSQDSFEFRLLIKLKGIQSIKKRILFMNIELPFLVV